MSEPEFFQTYLGRRFYEHDVPQIADALESIAASLKTGLPKQEQPTIMALCEVAHIFLRPDITYKFIEMPGCEKCKKLADIYRKEHT